MKSKLYFFLKNYFGFSNRESRGFVLVLPVLFILYIFPIFYGWILENRESKHYEEYLMKADSLQQAGWALFPNSQLNSTAKVQDTLTKKRPYQGVKSPELNRMLFLEADSIELQIVPGIGQTLAGRIVKYRENLGGFNQKEQLLEVYGIQPEVMDRVFDYFEFQPNIYRKIKINEADVATLANHPYLNFGTAKVIVAYREQHGNYDKSEDLLKIRIFNQDWLDRIQPYLQF